MALPRGRLVFALLLAVAVLPLASDTCPPDEAAIAGRLLERGAAVRTTRPDLSRLLAVAAWELAPSPANRLAMISAELDPLLGVVAFPASGNDKTLSPDGDEVAVCAGGRPSFWDARTGRPLRRASGGPSPAPSAGPGCDGVVYGMDGRRLLTIDNLHNAYVWDAASGGFVAGPLSGTSRAAFGPDSATVFTLDIGGELRRWGATTGRPLGGPLARTPGAQRVAVSADGRYVAAAGRELVVYDLARNREVVRAPTGIDVLAWAVALAFSPDGRTVATGAPGSRLTLWDVPSGRSRRPLKRSEALAVCAIAWSPDGTVIATGRQDGPVQLWDAVSGSPVGPTLAGHFLWADCLRFRGQLVTCGWDEVRRWRWDGYQRGRVLIRQASAVLSVAVSPDGTMVATGAADGAARLWRTADGHRMGEPMIPRNGIGEKIGAAGVAFVGTGSTLAVTGRELGSQLWDVATGGFLISTYDYGTVLAGSRDGRVFATAGSGPNLYSAHSLRQIGYTSGGGPTHYRSLAFSPDGRTLAGGSDLGEVRFWDVRGWTPVKGASLTHDSRVTSLAYSPDGSLLAVAGESGRIRLWSAAARRPTGPFIDAHTAAVRSIAFTPDGRALATAGQDGAVRLWDVPSGRPLGTPMLAGAGPVNALAFLPGGRALLTAHDDGTVRRWDLSDVLDAAGNVCAHAGRALTRAEWAMYAAGAPYRPVCLTAEP
ncbi:WD40 repeat domain-containing protein [Microbispora sp. GKU 823]|uniref:WD40 repeat domain-containing protein n=1 Tax=Microbispora sp. GKU 823 TaxID=1652100 RepID=UPI0009A42E0D|nr:WD40 repeat domain-containing protein [Microbispora sp. GKU 823]OPG09858.1 hypothetical protein B1L11_24985 [Microbispora sp. GKU 823]